MDEEWEISADELKSELDGNGEMRIVDIRSRDAFEHGCIPGSENIPFGELPQRVGELDDAERVITICPLGKSSLKAAKLIASYEGTREATVKSLACGLQGWEYEFESTESESEANAPF